MLVEEVVNIKSKFLLSLDWLISRRYCGVSANGCSEIRGYSDENQTSLSLPFSPNKADQNKSSTSTAKRLPSSQLRRQEI